LQRNNQHPAALKIFINDREIIVFRGAMVKDAVRSYSMRSSKQLEAGILLIVDKYGNKTEADGELTDGQKLYLKRSDHA
jgi:hypothetical protein